MAVATTASTKLERPELPATPLLGIGPASQSTRRLIVARSCCRSLNDHGGFAHAARQAAPTSPEGRRRPTDPAADAGGAPLDAGCAGNRRRAARQSMPARVQACAAFARRDRRRRPARKIACGSGYLLGMSGGPRLLSFAARFHGGLRHGPARLRDRRQAVEVACQRVGRLALSSGPAPAHRGRNG